MIKLVLVTFSPGYKCNVVTVETILTKKRGKEKGYGGQKRILSAKEQQLLNPGHVGDSLAGTDGTKLMPGGGDVVYKLRIARQVATEDFFQG